MRLAEKTVYSTMLKTLFLGMLQSSCSVPFGKDIGLAPIVFAQSPPPSEGPETSTEYSWARDYDR